MIKDIFKKIVTATTVDDVEPNLGKNCSHCDRDKFIACRDRIYSLLAMLDITPKKTTSIHKALRENPCPLNKLSPEIREKYQCIMEVINF